MIVVEQVKQGNWIIIASFIIALMLTAMPLPDWAASWRPAWVAVVLVYWCMAVPDRVGISVGWFSGLILDVQQGAVLGLNALGMSIIAYMTIKSYQRIRVFPLIQQAILICFYLLLYQFVVLLINGYMGRGTQAWTYWMPAFTSMLIWPWLFIILRDIRRKYDIS